ncbi:MBL fold metallo-hydrolase [Mesobacillus foraminis]|uniref:Glyoxylase-like metal-dependent hydrolase (Beta-lactamase superfamily II) n=1 Tax=Mesobacillus foraminis TaxID=279826 RepID=A0A4R2BBG0_9BACI|nr:MBL fold metallo-hydrolase [Mesobacillus foraminis]TCN22879.1 glyoxylase-like metal-dependent hydrolase (beta-lactamase superfamily II) [Mesobacillus foraminis]
MEWYQLPLGPLQTNCYILSNRNNSCLIIDPGEEAEKVFRYLNQKKLKPAAILLTHAHFDHIGAVEPIRAKYSVPVYLHTQEKKWLTDPVLNGSRLFGMGEVKAEPADYLLSGNQDLSIGEFTFTVLETPGHSPGSISFYFQEAGLVASGDALFQGSIGRTDLPGGSHETLLKSIHKKLLVMPEETLVLSGHGPVTTIRQEMDSNPFLNGF